MAYGCSLLDRGSIGDRLWNAINAVGSSSDCRSQDTTLATVTHVNDLTDADRATNVISNELIGTREFAEARTQRGAAHALERVWEQAQP